MLSPKFAKQSTAVVLGGTDDHIALIEKLKHRNYHTVLVDYLENPPAKQAADEHVIENAFDENQVLKIAIEHSAKIVISTCIDQALNISCRVAEKLQLPAPLDSINAGLVTNKLKMKRRMIETGIPTSSFIEVTNVGDLENINLRYPLVVKPSDSHGSFGVRTVTSNNELIASVINALEISLSNRAIVEEFNPGIEVSVDALLANDEQIILMCSQLEKKPIDGGVNLIFQSIAPAPITSTAHDKIKQIVEKIAVAFNLRNTPLLVQLIVNNDEVTVIEFSPRIGGGSKHQIIKHATGFDILEAAISSFHHETISIKWNSSETFYSRSYVYAAPGTFSRVANIEPLVSDGTIVDFVLYKTPGMQIGNHHASKDRIGSFMVRGNSSTELREKIAHAVRTLEVYDKDNLPIMRKEIFQGPHS